MNENEQILEIVDLLVEFDEMGFIPTTTVPHPEAYAIKWRDQMTKALQDYRKVERGEWIEKTHDWDFGDYIDYTCSICGSREQNKRKFCPECGADMRGAADER